MTTPEQILTLRTAGKTALERLISYQGFAGRTFAKYEAVSKGGRMPSAAAYLQRDLDVIGAAVAYTFEFETLVAPHLTAAQVNGLTRQRALFDDVAAFYAKGGNHRERVGEALSGDHGLTQAEMQRMTRAPDVILRALEAFDRAMSAVLADAESDASDTHQDAGAAQSNGASKGERTMSHDNKDDALSGIIDAISRLQGQSIGYGGIGNPGNVFSVFDAQLQQKLLQRGFPNPSSDTALAVQDDSLADKLFDTLDRTISSDEVGGVATYTFNPLKARGAIIGTDGTALGAQGVAAETIRNLKAPVMTNVNALVSESVVGEQDEADDLRQAIDDGLEQLIAEASSERGVFFNWLDEIIDTIFRDLMALADLYDIRDPKNKRRYGPITESLSSMRDMSPQQILDKLSFDPAPTRLLAEPDIGILTAEANDRALKAILSKLLLMLLLIRPDGDLGPILGRVRALNDALSSSVLAAEYALSAAGLSEGDQIVTFAGEGVGNIDLRRLLEWIKDESVSSRAFLFREDLNQSDLRRLRSARATQAEALQAFLEEDFPTVTQNAFSLGRRQLEEVHQHLCRIVRLMNHLIRPRRDDDDVDVNQSASAS